MCGIVYFASTVQCQSCTGLMNMIADMGKDISTAMHSQPRCLRKPGTFIILLFQRVGDITFTENQSRELSAFIGRISRFKPLFNFNHPSHQPIFSRKFLTALAISCPTSILRPPHHIICWTLRKSIKHVFSRAHPPNGPSRSTTLQSNCQQRAAFPVFQHTSWPLIQCLLRVTASPSQHSRINSDF